MSALLHRTHHTTCIEVFDFEPPRGEKMDQYISAYACAHAVTVYADYMRRPEPATAIEPPHIKHTFQRVHMQPTSFASYPIGSVLCLQVDDFTCKLMMVVNKDVGWVRTNIRHRVLDLGEVVFIPIQPNVLSRYAREYVLKSSQQHIVQMDNLERENIALSEKNEVLQERCERLLQQVRLIAGDKVACEAVNTVGTHPHIMSYTPLTMTDV